MSDRLLLVSEAAQIMRRRKADVYRMVKDGTIPSINVGGARGTRILESALCSNLSQSCSNPTDTYGTPRNSREPKQRRKAQ
jgi:excisionase family DNA binding protein